MIRHIQNTRVPKKPLRRDMKVFIADDSGVVRERLKDMLSEIDGIKIVGQAAEVGEAIGSIKNLKPDLAILDIKMIGGSGITNTQGDKKD
jgi:DNA-binding NarL/FixJ family response regulator